MHAPANAESYFYLITTTKRTQYQHPRVASRGSFRHNESCVNFRIQKGSLDHPKEIANKDGMVPHLF